MGQFLNFFTRKTVRTLADDTYREQRIGSLTFPESLTDRNAFNLANTVPEIYWPIDFCADRISKIRFYIADKNGKELPNSELNRFITDINPFWGFSDLMYQYIFSLLADGNAIKLLGVPSTYKTISPATIERCDILNPNSVTLNEYTGVSMLKVKNLTDLVRSARIETGTGWGDTLIGDELAKLKITKLDSTVRDNSIFLSSSQLYKGIRPINNLLAAYSARYNSYVNNGMAGLLVRKSGGTSDTGGLASAINGSPTTRNAIMDDLNDRYGVTGKSRRLWGITGQPLEFINTIASIKDLMPFEETLEDSIKIASIFQIPSGLVPRRDNPTFDNLAAMESSVWENALKSIAESACESFTRDFGFGKFGSIQPDYEGVSVLASNMTEEEGLIKLQIENLTALKAGADEAMTKRINKQIEKILIGYEAR